MSLATHFLVFHVLVALATAKPFSLVRNTLQDEQHVHLLQQKIQDSWHTNVSSFRTHGSIRLEESVATALLSLPGAVTVPTTVLTGSTQRHVDSQETTHGQDTVILFTNTNPDAYLSIGDEIVSVEAGSLVRFRGGSIPHHTVVHAGHVSFVGPFNSQSFGRVGCIPNGGACNRARNCCSSVCLDNVCVCNVQPGGACSVESGSNTDEFCCNDMKCDLTDGLNVCTCVQDGGACQIGLQCCNEFCDDGVCGTGAECIQEGIFGSLQCKK